MALEEMGHLASFLAPWQVRYIRYPDRSPCRFFTQGSAICDKMVSWTRDARA
jgi:hypothetical protein